MPTPLSSPETTDPGYAVSPTADVVELRRKIFFQHAVERTKRVQTEQLRFVYYTTAEVAYSILKRKEIWMRNASTMNDYMEVEHGLQCLSQAHKSGKGQRFQAALDSCFPSLSQEVRDLFDAWVPGFRGDTFMTCVSEHPQHEDTNGRLSMWRAYGGRSGVAIVFDSEVMFMQTDALAAYASPVAYFGPAEVADQLDRVADAIEQNLDFLCSLGRSALKSTAFEMLRFAALCTKHPGFSEEREWRVLASPALQASPLLSQDIELVRGVPQTVLKIRLQDSLDDGVVGLEIPLLIKRIIIGPCDFPHVVARALRTLLGDAGVAEHMDKVVVSDIPLRHS